MKYYENFKNATNEEEVKNNGLIPTMKLIGRVTSMSFEYKKIDMIFKLEVEKEKPILTLVETKKDENIAWYKDRAKVIIQIIPYLHALFTSGNIIKPSVVLLCDKNGIVAIPVTLLKKYVDNLTGKYGYNPKEISASQLKNFNSNLLNDIVNDKELENLIFFSARDSSEEDIKNSIVKISKEEDYRIDLTKENLRRVVSQFGDFVKCDEKIIKNNNDLALVKKGFMFEPDEYYQHPNKKNVGVTPLGEISIDPLKYKEYRSNINDFVKPSVKEEAEKQFDILVDEEERRQKGQYYTPSIWAEYMNKKCEEHFGNDYRQKYVTWDPCCGAKALTRSYEDWENLYCSTLEQAEIKNSENFNSSATSFVFDFLDEPLEDLISRAEGIINALKANKNIIFVMNPPYATACNMKNDYKHKSSINGRSELFKMQAKEAGFNFSCENLYMQFLEKVCYLVKHYHIANYELALFCPVKILINPKFKNFRKVFLNIFNYEYGCQFNAGEFADVKSTWNIAMTLWSAGESKVKNGFEMDNLINNNYNIEIVDTKKVYNADNKIELNKWMRNKTPRLAYRSAPSFSSGLVDKSTASSASGLLPKSIGYIFCLSKSGEYNTGIMSTGFSASHGNSITADNFSSACAFFSARNLINNEQTMLVAPNEKHADYQQFINDSVIYSIFNGKNNATSLRNIAYAPNGKTAILNDSPTVKYDGNGFWNINNAWYPLSASETNKLADDNYLKQTYDETKTASDSFVYNWLKGKTLSAQAQKVLDMGCNLIRKSFQFRQKYDEENPNYQIMNWDCGWYQIKELAKEYMKDDFTNFQKEYKILSEEMSKKVYELGFIIGD